jgi:toxin-antitoxin system PIN domain toxin
VILLDANLLLYAYFTSFPVHGEARRWLERVLSGHRLVGLAWSTVHAFIRIASNPRAFTPPMSPSEAATIAHGWLGLPVVRSVVPGEHYWGIFRGLLAKAQVTSALVPDAHLAALAIEQGFTLCTNDRDFSRFPGLDVAYPLLEAEVKRS